MAKKTLNYNLIKPEYTESADIEILNENTDIIDATLKVLSDEIGDKSTLMTEDKSSLVGAVNELFTDVGDGKNAVAAAITDMGQAAAGSDTFADLSTKIRSISSDANAATGDVLSGKTFYQGGSKKIGAMPNQGAKIIAPGTTSKAIPAGYHNGSGYVEGDAGLIPANIKSGINIFGVAGSYEGAGEYGTATAAQVLTGYTIGTDGGLVDGTMPNRGAVSQSLDINGSYTIPAGYHNGAGKVNQSITTKGAQTYTPGTSNQTIASGQYLSGVQTIKGDANLVAGNVKNGVSIFGVTGTAKTLAPGDFIVASNDAERTAGSTYNEFLQPYGGLMKAITVSKGATYRIVYDLKGGNSTYPVEARLIININENLTPVGIKRTSTSSSYVTYSEDITLSDGDKICIYGIYNSTSYRPTVRNFRLSLDLGTFTNNLE